MKLIRVTTEDGESVEFESDKVLVRHKPEGVTLTPRFMHENDMGFTILFYPWNAVRQIKEYEQSE